MKVGQVIGPEWEQSSAEELVRTAQERFGARAVFACSFGAEDMVLIDMIARHRPPNGRGIRVISLDTGRLFPETYDLIQRARERYGMPIELYFPDSAEVQAMVRERGPNLFYDSVANRKLCCAVRKVHPLDRALAGVDAWIVGLRREQSTERSATPKVSRDPAHPRIVKISPLAEWSWTDVLEYVDRHKVPISDLHRQGFLSIGCAPCTRAVPPGTDPRSGRWWWESGTKECGLHAPPATNQGIPTPTAIPPSLTARMANGPAVRRDVLIL